MGPKTLNRRGRGLLRRFSILMLLILAAGRLSAQVAGMLINLAALDGVPVTPDNLFSYTIQSNVARPTDVQVKGTLRYRQSNLSFSYAFHTTLRQGLNRIDGGAVRPEWTFSDNALRELFLDYRILPEGTYEYCVSINPIGTSGELITGQEVNECLYNKSEDLFLINLIDPENNAKLYERYPVFSWIVNYPFASQLTYRVRVAEIKEGQNTVNAVNRNNPVYTESNLPQTTTTYPVYGSPLKTAQPYAWTVDAYYKGILLGGAEPWKFMIVEDSELIGIPRISPFVDIKREQNAANYWAVGYVRLKYTLDERTTELLTLSLTDKNGNTVKLKDAQLKAIHGDNRFEINLKDKSAVRHLERYVLTVSNTSGETFHLAFRYVNPDFL